MKAAYHLAFAFGKHCGLGARAAQQEKCKLGRHGLAETSESPLSGQEGAARHVDGLAARSDERHLTHEQLVFVGDREVSGSGGCEGVCEAPTCT
tara:strand:- start:97 stop:378 length:282 start_codon:yes stop_codon:yes gene_type:complete|eukprot:scaffold21536_cov39-Phaeocystis_antarctica.AAC.2